MDANLLVVSPNSQFGHLIQHSLTQGGVYQVTLCQSAADAHARARQSQFHLAILDLESADPDLIALGRRFQQGSVKLPLIIFPPGNDPGSALLEDLRAQAYLMKPFYLPEMAETVERLLQPSPAQTASEASPAWQFFLTPDFNFTLLPWINGRDEAEAYITNLAHDSGAEAALLIQNGNLKGYAGQLELDSAVQMTALVQPTTDQAEVDSARFISLPDTQKTFLVYTTSLVGDLILGLVYDTKTPLSHIRSQANQISSNLAGAQDETLGSDQPASVTEEDAVWQPEKIEQPLETGSEAVIAAVDDMQAAETMEEEAIADAEEALPAAPVSTDFKEAWIPDVAPDLLETAIVAEDTDERMPDTIAEANLSDQPTPEVEAFLAQPDQENPPVDTLADTNPRLFAAAGELKPYPAPGLSNLTYTGVFIPRLPGHSLVGTLGEQLAQIVTNACLAFGWNLEGLAVRSDHMEWIIRASPATAPARILAGLRRFTSEQIFEHAPELKEGNPSGDFWSPGYLIISGSRTLPTSLVQQYILETRQRQGITNGHALESG